MMFYRALQLNKEIKQQRRQLMHWVNLKGRKDPHVLEISQELDLSVLELQRIILEVKSMERNKSLIG